MLWEDMPLVGRIARAHGNRGQVIIDPETDFLHERYKPGSVVYICREASSGRSAGCSANSPPTCRCTASMAATWS